jgi:hypothetical protein
MWYGDFEAVNIFSILIHNCLVNSTATANSSVTDCLHFGSQPGINSVVPHSKGQCASGIFHISLLFMVSQICLGSKLLWHFGMR